MNTQHGHQGNGRLQRTPLLILILLGGALLCGAGRAQACSNDNNVESGTTCSRTRDRCTTANRSLPHRIR